MTISSIFQHQGWAHTSASAVPLRRNSRPIHESKNGHMQGNWKHLSEESCHDPSHGGFYMAKGAPYIRIGLPPRVVSGDRLVPSCCGLTARYLHCRRTYPMSRDWGCTSTYLLSSYVPILVYAALGAIPTVTCTPTSMVVCIP